MNIEILMEDVDIIVCHKPSGIPVQSAKLGQQDMVSLLKNMRAKRGELPEIYPVHRLDQPVEGVMVFAKNNKAAATLSRQMQEKQIDKYYYALVEGVPSAAGATLSDYLLRDGRTNTSRVVKASEKGAKKAVLSYKILEERQERALLEIHLDTGRHHQIRVQMSHAGYPIVGDKKYNPKCKDGYLPIALCSVRLEFLHPTTKEPMIFSIEPQGKVFLDK